MRDIILKKAKNRHYGGFTEILKGFESVCKPSSVVYGHLSRLAVTDKLKRYSRYPSDGQPLRRIPNLAASGVYMAYRITAVSVSSYLAFPSLQRKSLRFISVALSLRSPSPDVIRHPVLCSSDFPHDAFAPRDRITNSNRLYYTIFK